MIVEGYNLQNCTCSMNEQVEFNEIQVYNEPRFMLTCRNCGNSSPACQTKEQAVHKWNAAHTPIFG